MASLKGFEGLASQGQKRRLSRSLGVAQKLHQRLHPFFDALNVIIGTEPFAAIGYGAFRIILQVRCFGAARALNVVAHLQKLASGLPLFFDKLLVVLERLIKSFPQYEVIEAVFQGKAPARLSLHLEAVYKDLFEVLRVLAGVLTGSRGSKLSFKSRLRNSEGNL